VSGELSALSYEPSARSYELQSDGFADC